MILVENPSDPHYVLPFQAHSQVPISCSRTSSDSRRYGHLKIHSMLRAGATQKKLQNQMFDKQNLLNIFFVNILPVCSSLPLLPSRWHFLSSPIACVACERTELLRTEIHGRR